MTNAAAPSETQLDPKPKRIPFVRVNPEPGTQPDAGAIDVATILQNTILREGKVVPKRNDNQPPPAAEPDFRDARTILQQNVVHERAAGWTDVVLPEPRFLSRRTRDYLIALVLGNLGLVGLALVMPRNLITMMFAAGGMVVLSVGLTWTMFVVMDRY